MEFFLRSPERPKIIVSDDDIALLHDYKSRFKSDFEILAPTKMQDQLSKQEGARQSIFLRAPGIQYSHPLIKAALQFDYFVTTFSGWWISQHSERVAATVTGTKGKSTTSHLLAKLLTACGIKAKAVGNIGDLPCAEDGGDVKYVYELSSYHLHDLPKAVSLHLLTNIFDEHLDWHGGRKNYIDAKCRPATLDPNTTVILSKNFLEHTAKRVVRRVLVEDWVSIEGNEIKARDPNRPSEKTSSTTLRDGLLQHPATASAAAFAAVGAMLVCQCDSSSLLSKLSVILESGIELQSRHRVIRNGYGPHIRRRHFGDYPRSDGCVALCLER